jgi:hypothetical protein
MSVGREMKLDQTAPKARYEVGSNSAEGAKYYSQGQVPTCRDVAPGNPSKIYAQPS